jgi:hypothetical protein
MFTACSALAIFSGAPQVRSDLQLPPEKASRGSLARIRKECFADCARVAAAVLQRNAIAAMMSVVAAVIDPVHIIFGIPVWRAKRAESRRVKYWEIIGDNLSEAGWSWGCVSADAYTHRILAFLAKELAVAHEPRRFPKNDSFEGLTNA